MVLRFIFAILTAYRLAQLIVFDDGPLFIFARLREWVDILAKSEQVNRHSKLCDKISGFPTEKQQQETLRGPMSSVADGLHCPYCVGIWAAILCTILVTFPTKLGDILLTCLAIAGGQAILERNGK